MLAATPITVRYIREDWFFYMPQRNGTTTTDTKWRGGIAARFRGARRGLIAGLALVTAVSVLGTVAVVNSEPADAAVAAVTPNFGPNVTVFDPSMSTAQIQAAVDAIAARQIDNEMGTARYSLLFKPGTYGTGAAPLKFQVGYYTEVAGLGRNPTDVVINGSVDVYNRCLPPPPDSNLATYCVALNNFWRSLSNLTVNVSGGTTDCRKTGMFWAASQASPMRRVNINGNLTLMDYCTDQPQWASGGFIADSKTDSVTNGSQQQYIVRNSKVGSWSNGVWNQVFAGTIGAPATNFAQSITNPDGQPGSGTYTTLAANPVSRERPYLYVDSSGNYSVLVPTARVNSAGTTWQAGPTPGTSLPLSSFYLAKPSDSVSTINAQLAGGKNLLLTPGVYNVASSIAINRSGTVVLGMGIATLTAVNGSVPVTVADVRGAVIAGIMIDAGTVNSPALMTVGTAGVGPGCTDPANPTTLSDVFFRIGGPHVGKATLGLVVHSDDVLMDDIWSWRADHGVPGSFGWNVSPSDTGLVVNGDNVTGTGIFVEHYKKYNVIWNGENGRTIFFQNEMPYDPPNQTAWRTGPVLGYAGYKVADTVKKHELWGGGSYIYTNVDRTIHATRAFEVPVTPGVKFHSLLTVQLLAGLIDHVINNTGAVTPGPVAAPSFVTHFPAGATSSPYVRPVKTLVPCTNQPPPTTTPTVPPTTTTPTVPPATTTPTTPTVPTTTTPTTTTPTTTTPTTTTKPTVPTSTPTSGTPISGPGNLRWSTGSTSVTLTWSGDPAATYDILRGEGGVKIASVKGLTFTDSGLNVNTPYVYSVRGTGGTTPQITAVTGTQPTSTSPPTSPSTTSPSTTSPATTVPTGTTGPPVTGAPSNLRKTGQTASTISLGWTGSASGSYDILRGEAGDKIATVTGTSFTDIGLLANTPYVYSVRGAGVTTPQITLTISSTFSGTRALF